MKKIFFPFVVISIGIISCKKDFPIPKQPAEISPSLILTAALTGTASNVATNYLALGRWMGYWARSRDFQTDTPTETYDIKNDYTDKEWSVLYKNLSLYDYLEKLGRNNNDPFYIGAAKAMKAYNFSTLVDLYDDVPYRQAFDNATKDQPEYDKGPDIYNDLITQLDSAFIYFENAREFYKAASASVVTTDDVNDVMFGGARSGTGGYSHRLTLWEKFTNTLELKLLMHESKVASMQSFIQQEISNFTIQQARKAAGFIKAGENATVNPGYDGSSHGKPNPFYFYFFVPEGIDFYTSPINYYRENAYAGNFYTGSNDPRNNLIYNQNFENNIVDDLGVGGYAYTTIGDTILTLLDSFTLNYSYPNFSYTFPTYKLGSIYDGDDHYLNNYDTFSSPVFYNLVSFGGLNGMTYGDRIGRGLLKGFHQDQIILSDFESLFLQAEAVQRGYINSNAQTLYESAITQNFVYLYKGNSGDPAGDANKYFSQSLPDVGWIASPNKLEAIMTQKWAAMNGVNWVEAYNDYRRTGYPTSNVLGISHAPTHVRPQIPTRFLYPESQLNTNSAHVPPLPDAQYSKIFWNQ